MPSTLAGMKLKVCNLHIGFPHMYITDKCDLCELMVKTVPAPVLGPPIKSLFELAGGVTVPAKPEPEAWRQFQHNAPGDCPCGIARVQCTYHRS